MDVKREYEPESHGMEPSIKCLIRNICKESGELGNKPILHYHDHFEILYGISGVAARSFSDKTDYLRAGDLAIINARAPHDGTSNVDGTKYLVIKFLPEVLDVGGRILTDVRYLMPLWQKTIGLSPIIHADELAGSGIDELMREIIYEWDHKSRGYQSVIRSNIIKIFIWTLRNRCPAVDASDNLPESLYIAMQPAFEAAQSNLCDLTAKDAARLCGLSYSYFSRSFKKAFGMSFTAYYESVRLREAERLLLTTDHEITAIAADVGFSTTSYFIERFGTFYGTTPLAFRKSVKNAHKA